MKKEFSEVNITQIMERYQAILEQEVPRLARETGAVKRERKNGFDAVTLVEIVLFGFWQEPDLRLSGLAQVAGRREVAVSAEAMSQRFRPACATLFHQVLQRFTEVQLASEKVEVPLLKQFSAVIVEERSTITLPAELACIWQGCGGGEAMSEAAVKIVVRSYVLGGQVLGPHLTDGRTNDHQSPLSEQELPASSLSLADLGFFGQKRLREI